MICPHCGSEASGNFCSTCGAPLTSPAARTSAPMTAAQTPAAIPEQTFSPAAPATAPEQTSSSTEPATPPLAAAPGEKTPPPAAAPAAPGAFLCPVCRQTNLDLTMVKTALGLHHQAGLICSHCGSLLLEDKNDATRFELTATHEPSLSAWQTYAHKTLPAQEWQHIAAGGASDEEQAKLDLATELALLRAGRVTFATPGQAPLLLQAGERLVFVFDAITLREPHSVSTGYYGGPSLHVAKGLTIRTGAFRAQSHEELKDIDSGTLSLTNKRLVFAGALRSVEVALAKLTSIEAYSDAIAIRRAGREKTQLFFGLGEVAYTFRVEGRRHSEPCSGLIVKYAVEGLLAQGSSPKA
ncbi:MAG: hypothetical protein ACLQUT_11815 [Thermoleophilia bacterium]